MTSATNIPNEGQKYLLLIEVRKGFQLGKGSYVKVKIEDQIQKTTIDKEYEDPIWNEKLLFRFDHIPNQIEFNVKHHSTLLPNSKIGDYIMDIHLPSQDIAFPFKLIEEEIALDHSKGGKLDIKITLHNMEDTTHDTVQNEKINNTNQIQQMEQISNTSPIKSIEEQEQLVRAQDIETQDSHSNQCSYCNNMGTQGDVSGVSLCPYCQTTHTSGDNENMNQMEQQRIGNEDYKTANDMVSNNMGSTNNNNVTLNNIGLHNNDSGLTSSNYNNTTANNNNNLISSGSTGMETSNEIKRSNEISGNDGITSNNNISPISIQQQEPLQQQVQPVEEIIEEKQITIEQPVEIHRKVIYVEKPKIIEVPIYKETHEYIREEPQYIKYDANVVVEDLGTKDISQLSPEELKKLREYANVSSEVEPSIQFETEHIKLAPEIRQVPPQIQEKEILYEQPVEIERRHIETIKPTVIEDVKIIKEHVVTKVEPETKTAKPIIVREDEKFFSENRNENENIGENTTATSNTTANAEQITL